MKNGPRRWSPTAAVLAAAVATFAVPPSTPAAPLSAPAVPGYLGPGTPDVGGIRRMCLLYHGAKHRVAWFHHYREGAPQATAEDWAWLADAWFRNSANSNFQVVEFEMYPPDR